MNSRIKKRIDEKKYYAERYISNVEKNISAYAIFTATIELGYFESCITSAFMLKEILPEEYTLLYDYYSSLSRRLLKYSLDLDHKNDERRRHETEQ